MWRRGVDGPETLRRRRPRTGPVGRRLARPFCFLPSSRPATIRGTKWTSRKEHGMTRPKHRVQAMCWRHSIEARIPGPRVGSTGSEREGAPLGGGRLIDQRMARKWRTGAMQASEVEGEQPVVSTTRRSGRRCAVDEPDFEARLRACSRSGRMCRRSGQSACNGASSSSEQLEERGPEGSARRVEPRSLEGRELRRGLGFLNATSDSAAGQRACLCISRGGFEEVERVHEKELKRLS